MEVITNINGKYIASDLIKRKIDGKAKSLNTIVDELEQKTHFNKDEIVIGTYNGKPLYGLNLILNDVNSTSKNFDLSNYHIDLIFIKYGVLKSNAGTMYPFPYHYTNSNEFRTSVEFQMSNGVVTALNYVSTGSSYCSGTAYVTIEYTKSTD